MENYRKITEKLHNLKKEIRKCRACSLSLSRRNTVFGEGNPLSPFMIIGEAPGANEDEMSAPFVGKAGKFLDGCLAECGLDRSLIFISNVMKCRPSSPDGKRNRPPTAEETGLCSPWLIKQTEIIKPKIILALGAPAAKFLFGKKTVKMGEIRGKFLESVYCDYAMASLHPSYILTYKGPAEREMLISDIKACMAKLKEENIPLVLGEIYTDRVRDLFGE